MSVAVAVWLAVSIITAVLLAVLMLQLIRNLKLLAGALARYRDEVQPLLERMQRESARARERAETVPSRLPDRKPGARLRK